MRKSGKTMSISAVIILGVIMLLYFGGIFTNNKIIDIPNKSDITFMELYDDNRGKYNVVEGDKHIAEIYDSLLEGKNSRSMERISDTPNDVNGNVTRIVLTDNSKKATTIFAYEANDGKYYIEKPYEGIYEISAKEYGVFTQYFMAG